MIFTEVLHGRVHSLRDAADLEEWLLLAPGLYVNLALKLTVAHVSFYLRAGRARYLHHPLNTAISLIGAYHFFMVAALLRLLK